MQSLKFFILIFLMIFCGCSQISLSQPSKQAISRSSEILPKEIIFEKLKKGNWVKEKKEILTCNSKGKLEEKKHFKWNKDAWKVIGKTKFYYSNGKLKQEVYNSVLTNGDFSETKKEVHFYNSKNQLSKTEYFIYSNNNSVWVFEGETKFDYNNLGKIKSKNLSQKLDENTKINIKETFEYNSKNQLSKMRIENFNHKNQIESEFEKKFSYNSKGKILEVEHWNRGLYFSKEPFLEKKIKYNYNSNGNLDKKVSYKKVGNQLKESTREIFR